MKIYISGAISGLPKEAYERRFGAVTKNLRELGHEVISPIENECPSDDWCEQMLECLHKLVGCDTIYMLEGWKGSTGAKIEMQFAMMKGLKIIEETQQSLSDL